MISDLFLCTIPDRLKELIESGKAYVQGINIRDSGTGRFLGHLQETGLLSESAGLGTLNSLLSGQAAIGTALQGLQLLSGVNLALTAVGLGISICGFVAVTNRLKCIQEQLSRVERTAIESRLDIAVIKYRQESRDWARLEALLYQGEEAWYLSSPQSKWQELLGPLDEEQRYWRGLIGGVSNPSILVDERFTLEQAVAAYDGAIVLASARTQTLLLLNELPAARRYATDVQTWHDKAMLNLDWAEIAQARTHELAGKEAAEAARPKLREKCVRFMNGVIAIQELLASRVELIDTLQQRNIKGLEYVKMVRSQNDAPLMVLLRE